MNLTTLAKLRRSPIATTDTGEFITIDGLPEIEFLVKGTIKKIRAGLFFIDIEGENYTFPKKDGFNLDEEIICILRAEVNSNNVDIDDNNAKFTIRGLERSE